MIEDWKTRASPFINQEAMSHVKCVRDRPGILARDDELKNFYISITAESIGPINSWIDRRNMPINAFDPSFNGKSN